MAYRFAGLLLQALQADRLQVARRGGLELARRDRLPRPHQVERLEGSRRTEGGVARQQLVNDRAQAVDVGRRPDVHCAGLGLLGGHVAGGADELAGLGQADVGGERPGQAEVADLRLPVGGQAGRWPA